jgi:hypothetical protein
MSTSDDDQDTRSASSSSNDNRGNDGDDDDNDIEASGTLLRPRRRELSSLAIAGTIVPSDMGSNAEVGEQRGRGGETSTFRGVRKGVFRPREKELHYLSTVDEILEGLDEVDIDADDDEEGGDDGTGGCQT